MTSCLRATALTLLLSASILSSVPLGAEETAIPVEQPPAADSAPTLAPVPEPAPETFNRPIRSSVAKDQTGFHPDRLSLADQGESLFVDASDRALYQKYLAQYSGASGAKWLEAVMAKGEPYMAFIFAKAQEHGIPPELAYLPVIESGFSGKARSRSGAVGLWQFMRNSISPFGIKVDDWMDERRDFWKATDAAFRKLNENYRYFHDWPLALAAYNAGLGAVDRACKRGGTRDYWELCDRKILKTETIHYVPKFLAVARVLSDAQRAGIDLGWPEEPRWTRIKLDRSVDLGLLADYSRVPVSRLRAGNSELNYGVTPNGRDYQLKVWEKDRAAIETTLARKELQLIKYYFHSVKSGDTLSALSRHYGVSVAMIERSNPGLTARYLKLGSRIVVPALKDVGPYEGSHKDDDNVVFSGRHTVQKGDTLWSLALAFNVDPELLAQANGMTLSSVLREGKTLKTPILNPRS